VPPRYVRPDADPARLTDALRIAGPTALFADTAGNAETVYAHAPALRAMPLLSPTGADFGIPLDRVRGTPVADHHPEHADGGRLILMTSGSTGKPKAAICTQAAMSVNAAQAAACLDDPDPPLILNAAPWNHALGALSVRQRILHQGGSFHVDHGEPTPAGIGETIANLRTLNPTYHHMVPAGWALLAHALEADETLAATFFSRLRVMQYGGAQLPEAVSARIQAAAVRATGERICLVSGFGATETGPLICNIHWPNAEAGIAGLPIPGTAIRLMPSAGKLEICAKGPQLSPGYIGENGAIVPLPLDDEGFYHLGDAGKPALIDDRLVIRFDGRLVENFKLVTGTFVTAGALRLAALSAIGGFAMDCVVCGEGQDSVGLLIFLNRDYCNRSLGADLPLADLAAHDGVRTAIGNGLAAMNAGAGGSARQVRRVLILPNAPDGPSGEITEKGYLNQALCRVRYASEIARLYAAADPDVLRID
jgi:feruloyl-CoA synthase